MGVANLYGRRIDPKAKQDSRHFYLPGPRQGVFNSEAMAASDEIVICEFIIEAVPYWVEGVRNVTSSGEPTASPTTCGKHFVKMKSAACCWR